MARRWGRRQQPLELRFVIQMFLERTGVQLSTYEMHDGSDRIGAVHFPMSPFILPRMIRQPQHWVARLRVHVRYRPEADIHSRFGLESIVCQMRAYDRRTCQVAAIGK